MEESNVSKFKKLIDFENQHCTNGELSSILGVSENEEPILFDFGRFPHLFIGGTPGSGVSSFMRFLLTSMLVSDKHKNSKFIIIDTKGVEFSEFNSVSGLVVPVITNEKKAAAAVSYLIHESNKRFHLLSENKCRTLDSYNNTIEDKEKISHIFLFIDEFIPIFDIENVTSDLLKLIIDGRTVGIHIILSTQNLSDKNSKKLMNAISNKCCLVLNSLQLKNVFERDFEKTPQNLGEFICNVDINNYIFGSFFYLSENETKELLNEKHSGGPQYNINLMNDIEKTFSKSLGHNFDDSEEPDPLLGEAEEFAVLAGQITTMMIQKKLKLGYMRSSKIIDQLEENGVIAPADGVKPRTVLITKEEYYLKHPEKTPPAENISESQSTENKASTNVNLSPEFASEISTKPTIKKETKQPSKEVKQEKENKPKKAKKKYTPKQIALFVIPVIIFLITLFSHIHFLAKVMIFGLCIFVSVWIQNKYEESEIRYSINTIDAMDGHTFEYCVAKLLSQNGYTDVQVTQGSGDFGIDVLATKDGCRYAIQCKNYSGNVGVSAVQEAYSGRSYYNCNYAVVITNSYFTKAAIELANSTGVALWDREYLKMLLSNQSGKSNVTFTNNQSNRRFSKQQKQQGCGCALLLLAVLMFFVLFSTPSDTDTDGSATVSNTTQSVQETTKK